MPNPNELRIGDDVITATRPDQDSPYRDFDINSAGYIRLVDPGLDWFRQSGQGNFSSPEQYYQWVFGGGSTVRGSDGQTYFKTPNGVDKIVNMPLQYNKPDSTWDNLGLYLVGAIAGGGLLAGMGGAGAAAGTGGLSAADIAGLTQMGADAGLQGAALQSFVQSGGTLGSLAAGGGGVQAMQSVLTDVYGATPQQAAQITSNPSLLEQITNAPASALQNVLSSGMDWGKIISTGGSLLGSYLSGKAAEDAANQAAQMADPFASQRAQYQARLPGMLDQFGNRSNRFIRDADKFNEQYQNKYHRFQRDYRGEYDQFKHQYRNQYDNFLKDFNRERNQFNQGYQTQYNDFRGTLDQMFDDPNYWANNSLLTGLNQNAINDTSRELASRGYNMSGNEQMEIAQRLQNNNAQFAGQQQQNYTNYAGQFLNSYANQGLGSLNSFGTNRLGALNSFGETGTNRLNNFSNTGIASLNNFSTTGMNQQSNYLNYLNNQLGAINTVGNFAGANVSDPARAGYLYQQGQQNAQANWNNMWGNAGILANQFFSGGSGGTYEGSA